ncbi:hypothetical protein GPALN_006241 [Globodera pallida]|nr:hypothetical protein GPALN_006241 [Globodera pallida]
MPNPKKLLEDLVRHPIYQNLSLGTESQTKLIYDQLVENWAVVIFMDQFCTLRFFSLSQLPPYIIVFSDRVTEAVKACNVKASALKTIRVDKDKDIVQYLIDRCGSSEVPRLFIGGNIMAPGGKNHLVELIRQNVPLKDALIEAGAVCRNANSFRNKHQLFETFWSLKGF